MLLRRAGLISRAQSKQAAFGLEAHVLLPARLWLHGGAQHCCDLICRPATEDEEGLCCVYWASEAAERQYGRRRTAQEVLDFVKQLPPEWAAMMRQAFAHVFLPMKVQFFVFACIYECTGQLRLALSQQLVCPLQPWARPLMCRQLSLARL